MVCDFSIPQRSYSDSDSFKLPLGICTKNGDAEISSRRHAILKFCRAVFCHFSHIMISLTKVTTSFRRSLGLQLENCARYIVGLHVVDVHRPSPALIEAATPSAITSLTTGVRNVSDYCQSVTATYTYTYRTTVRT